MHSLKRKIEFFLFLVVFPGFIFHTWKGSSIYGNTVYYVQSPKAKLLTQPRMDSPGTPISFGTSVRSIGESGLFVQVRLPKSTGWISKLFLSTYPPGNQIKLGTSGNKSKSAQNRQRASDFTKTAAARGLSETERLRVRGESRNYDFEGLKWLERIGEPSNRNSDASSTDSPKKQSQGYNLFQIFSEDLPSTTKQEVKIGRSLAAKLIHKYGIVKNPEATIYINSIGQEISDSTSRTDLSFRFGILDTDEINAFACPGGFIFLTRGAFYSMQSESELATVLGHEISHVVLNHHGSFQGDNLFIELLSTALNPSGSEVITGATSQILTELENQLFEEGRDVQTEWEADQSGVYLVAQLGYQPRVFPEYLDRISKKKESTLHTKTHPSAFLRIKKLENIFSELNNYKVKSRDNLKFKTIQANL